MTRERALDQAHALAFLVPLGLLGGAYVAQYQFDLPPCEMCWWQRYPHFVALTLALVGLVVPIRRPLVALSGLAVLVSGAIGAFHAGVEYGWWEGITTCAATNLGGDDPLAAIMDAPIIRCDVAPWSLFGISLAGWNFLISTASALAIFVLVSKKRGS
ncbi:MAG TPA: disulfide bond formation protein B [Sphingomonadaceae bacterium]|nr:disulfide bond formation protein B [Sphingomonadaceae bacterium]